MTLRNLGMSSGFSKVLAFYENYNEKGESERFEAVKGNIGKKLQIFGVTSQLIAANYPP